MGLLEPRRELLPSGGGVGVEAGSPGVVADLFGLDGVHGRERVLLDRESRGNPIDEAGSELRITERGRADEAGQQRGVL